jgi:hypothetical protein
MSKPNNTNELRARLAEFQERIAALKRATGDLLEWQKENHLQFMGEALFDAATYAGMPIGSAAEYATGYRVYTDEAKRGLLEIQDQAENMGRAIGSAIHIAAVVPHRTPGSPTFLSFT